MKIDVTEEDILAGCYHDCELCPVALAMTRAYGFAVEVYGPSAKVGEGEVDLPAAVAEFVAAFDDGEAVTPFSFELPDLPA